MELKYRFVTNGKLKIVLYDHDIETSRGQAELYARSLAEEIRNGEYKGQLVPEDYINETERLLSIAEKILLTPDIFNYLPLTKAGTMPLNRNILIADSKCIDTEFYGGGAVSNNKLQLRLVDCYLTREEIFSGKPSNIAKRLEIRFFSINGKQEPIIDEAGRIQKVEQKKPAKYLKDTNITPGKVYTEKSGTKYLYLGKLELQMIAINNTTGKMDTYRPSISYHYIRFTDKLKASLQGIPNMNTLYRLLGNMYKDEDNGWISKCSIRENPRRFIGEAGSIIPDPTIIQDRFDTKGKNRNYFWRYNLRAAI